MQYTDNSLKMNREYRKFNELSSEVYIPPATAPEHFSNLPDVLIPPDYHEVKGDPLEKDVADLIRETETPPPTPPELEAGRAGCRLFREKTHYVDPVYKDENLQRLFTVKLIIYNFLSYIPTLIVLISIITSYQLDYKLLASPHYVVIAFLLGLLGIGIYIYFVGIFRNPPMLYIAIAIRCVLNICLFGCGMLLIHYCFLNIIDHPLSEEEEFNITKNDYTISDAERGYEELIDHPPPYLAIFSICLMGIVQCIIAYLLLRRKLAVTDYRLPFVIYTTCFSMSAFFVTIVLNGGFRQEPKAYDLFQVIVGCYMASMLLMRTPHFIGRLFEGKVCPLLEGEVVYALLHYGL